jgi:hypothetical protein
MAFALWPLDQVLGADAGIAPAGNIGELNATGAGGIDLYLEIGIMQSQSFRCRSSSICFDVRVSCSINSFAS